MPNNKQNESKLEFSFLSDSAIELIENDLLHHRSISRTIRSIINQCQTPFTLGVFGKWGTGKSTIGKFLIKDIKNDQNSKEEFKVVEFDVWKYEKDSLRRQFLIKIDESLQLDLNLKESLSQAITKPYTIPWKESFSFQFRSFMNRGFWLLITITIILFIIKNTNAASFLFEIGWLPPQLFSGLYDLSLFSLILSFIANSYVNVLGNIQIDKTDSAEGFENVFKNEILKHKKIKNKKLIVIVDNLDRVSKEKAVEVLSTIKTFLELDQCIFIIQCDEQAIKHHLIRMHESNGNNIGNQTYDADEYLRKFFNTYIYIPPFIGSDLRNYTEKLLKETAIEGFTDNDSLSTLISVSFRENPRQIKQFINTLISHYLLARERENDENTPILQKGSLTDKEKIPLIAKLLLIKQYDEEFYQGLIKDPKIFYNYEGRNQRLIELFDATPLIKAENNLRSFIFYKESDLSLKLLGIGESLKNALMSNNVESLDSLNKEIQSKNIEDVEVRRFISNDIFSDNALNTDELVNVINGLSRIELKATKTFSDRIIQKTQNFSEATLASLDLEYLFSLMYICTKEYRDNLSNTFIKLINLKVASKNEAAEIESYDQKVNLVLKQFISSSGKYQTILEELKQSIAKTYYSNNEVFQNIKKYNLMDKLISNEYISNLITSININDLNSELISLKANVLVSLQEKLSDKNIFDLFSKYHELLTNIKALPNDEQKTENIDQFLLIFDLFLNDHQNKIKEHPKLEDVGQIIYEISQPLQIEQKSKAVLSLFRLRPLMRDANRQARMQQEIFGIAERASTTSLEKVFNSVSKEEELIELLAFISSKLEPRAFNNKDFFLFYFDVIPDKDQFIKKALESPHYDIVLSLLNENAVTAVSREKVAQSIADNFFSFSGMDLKRKSLSYISDSSKKVKFNIRETYLSILERLLTTENDEQDLGREFYEKDNLVFSKSIRIAFSSQLLDWIETQPSLNRFQIVPIRTIISSWNIISKTNQEKIFNILFDRYLGKTDDQSIIEIIGDILAQIKPRPTYSKLSPHFEIIKARLEQSDDLSIKKSLVDQLVKIKPKKYSEGNSFWKFVDEKLSSYQNTEENI